jgi:NitT/TauT family transport system substrate-binding protein
MDRRAFMSASAVLGAATVLPLGHAGEESPPEIRRIRLLRGPANCMAPQIIADQFLVAEGFTEVEYIKIDRGTGADMVAQGIADISMWDSFATLLVADAHDSLVVLAGIHAGCWELFVNGRVRALRDLKGKTIAIRGFGVGDHVLLSAMFGYVGMDPRTDVHWLAGPKSTDAMPIFVEGKADAFMAFEPQPHELRERGIGRMILSTAQDRPWSQHYCCSVMANRDFVRSNPVAAKRALRAFMKATDICAQDPDRAAHMLVEKKMQPRHDIALSVLRSLPYDRWRNANPEDTLRFYALRLHEVGMIKTEPNQLIARSTDWRFLNELKKELKV